MKMKTFALITVASLAIITAGLGALDRRQTDVEKYQSKTRTGKTFISVYMEPNCKGRATKIEVPADLPSDAGLKTVGVKNDSIRSIKVPAGVVVTVCDGAAYKGDSLTLKDGEHDSMGKLDFRISSLKAEFTTSESR